MRSVHVLSLALFGGAAALVASASACARGVPAGFDSSSQGDVPLFGSAECTGLECGDAACTTTISGTVVAPNGEDPVYNAIVYVPSAPLAPIAQGSTCERCNVVS